MAVDNQKCRENPQKVEIVLRWPPLSMLVWYSHRTRLPVPRLTTLLMTMAHRVAARAPFALIGSWPSALERIQAIGFDLPQRTWRVREVGFGLCGRLHV